MSFHFRDFSAATRPGDLILDAFSGSGSLADAAFAARAEGGGA